MDLDVVMRSNDCQFIVKFYGALFKEVWYTPRARKSATWFSTIAIVFLDWFFKQLLYLSKREQILYKKVQNIQLYLEYDYLLKLQATWYSLMH